MGLNKYRHYINNNGNGNYHWFKNVKVYKAYRWYEGREVDRYCAKTPIRRQDGSYTCDITNYEKKYL
jgi:hypothetical protein